MSAALLIAAPASLLATAADAASFRIYEATLGAPGVTAVFAPGSGLLADIDYDADTAEGGSLHTGPTDIIIRPFGDVSLVAFTCQMGSCTEGIDWTFTSGTAGAGGQLEAHDSNPGSPLDGLFDIGLLEFDAPTSSGGLQLISCSYTDANAVGRQCDPFALVIVPEPGPAGLLGLGLGALALARRRPRRED